MIKSAFQEWIGSESVIARKISCLIILVGTVKFDESMKYWVNEII